MERNVLTYGRKTQSEGVKVKSKEFWGRGLCFVVARCEVNLNK